MANAFVWEDRQMAFTLSTDIIITPEVKVD